MITAFVMQKEGLEPSWYHYHTDLNRARLQKAEATLADQNHIFADTRSRAPLSAVMAVAYALCGHSSNPM